MEVYILNVSRDLDSFSEHSVDSINVLPCNLNFVFFGLKIV